jgi:predicted aconitase
LLPVTAPNLELSARDRDLLKGAGSEAEQLAKRVVTKMAEDKGASRLLDVTAAHIDSCLYHGEAGLDFAERLLAGGGRAVVPTTLNVSSLDLLHPDLYRGDAGVAARARRLMECYEAMNCRPTWTCAPYQLVDRPGFGEHVAWAESNAIVFANSVLGARTNRYGDFFDICAAITGRVPAAGLHLDEPRLATLLLRIHPDLSELTHNDVLYPVLGHLLGSAAGQEIAAIEGLPPGTTEDQLKAVAAGASSSGAVAMFHVIGATPEAATREAAFGGRRPQREIVVTPAAVAAARDDLTTATGSLGAVSVGTPHASLDEMERLVDLLGGRKVTAGIAFYVNTGRDVLAEAAAQGWESALASSGVTIVTDTCTYITPIIGDPGGVVMTDSAKWAYYAPGNLGVEVVFGSMLECVESAVTGRITVDEEMWRGL